jgi:hypothetical protein
MKILNESYTMEEIQQRIVDTRNIFVALQDSLEILESAFSDTDDVSKEDVDKYGRYVRGYERDVEALAEDFYDDFEKFIVDEEEEEDFEDDYEYEEDTDIEEE